MDTCPECGNSDLQVRVVDGVTVVECGLCGERVGQRRVLETLADREQAARYGYTAEVWPLVRALSRLGGLGVEAATAGDAARGIGPAVTMVLSSPRDLVQLDNVAKSLHLAAGVLHLPWTLAVESEHHLVFVLRPRGTPAWSEGTLRNARLDLETLARELDRNRKLKWWARSDGHH